MDSSLWQQLYKMEELTADQLSMAIEYKYIKLTVNFLGQSKIEFWFNDVTAKTLSPKLSLDVDYQQISVYCKILCTECIIKTESVRTIPNGMILTYCLDHKPTTLDN